MRLLAISDIYSPSWQVLHFAGSCIKVLGAFRTCKGWFQTNKRSVMKHDETWPIRGDSIEEGRFGFKFVKWYLNVNDSK